MRPSGWMRSACLLLGLAAACERPAGELPPPGDAGEVESPPPEPSPPAPEPAPDQPDEPDPGPQVPTQIVQGEAPCEVDADCVPSACCHPSSCVAAGDGPSCGDAMCTMDCQVGTMDCGGGCLCQEGRCAARIVTSLEPVE